MKRTGQLGSIHYDEQLLIDLWDRLSSYSDVNSSSVTVYHDSASTEFESPEELRSATQIPDRISRFELTVRATEGRVRISSKYNKHQYTVSGDEDWVRQISDFIREFSAERKNKLRSILTNGRLTSGQYLSIGGLIGAFWNKIIGIILPLYAVKLSTAQERLFWGFIATLVLLQVAKRVYPPVEFRRRGEAPRIRQVFFVLTLIGSVASVGQGAYWLWTASDIL
jgi:hypothetical protein